MPEPGVTAAATPAGTLDVAVVGLGFGAAFVPVYLSHPAVGRVGVCDQDRSRLDRFCDRLGVAPADRFTSLDELLATDRFAAVHLVTPVGLHAAQSVAVLRSGRHCACAVPMGLSLAEIEQVLAAAADGPAGYMMMETAVYQREYLYAADLVSSGRLGPITFLRGAHVRDRSEMPGYWRGFPPLKYATHAISPLLALAGTRVTAVHALGSGTLRPENRGGYDNPFALETALFRLADGDAAMEVTQGCFQTARAATEGFSVYGEAMSVEWPQLGEGHVEVFEMHARPEEPGSRFRQVVHTTVRPPDRTGHLPPEIAGFCAGGRYVPPHSGAPVDVPGHHSGSHPHLVHEFVSSALEGRPTRVHAGVAADWCAPGIAAHESALAGGARVRVPDFSGSTATAAAPGGRPAPDRPPTDARTR